GLEWRHLPMSRVMRRLLSQMALVARALHGEIPIQPAVARSLVVRRAAFHVVLRVEVRTRVARAADGVNRRENAVIPHSLEWRERPMQSEEPVETDRALRRTCGCPQGAWPRSRDVRSHLVVRDLTVRHYDVQRVRRATLEEHDQHFAARIPVERRALQQILRE